MGSWGPGVYENDHANDLLGIHVDELGEALEAALDEKNPSWTDIEGPLIYVHLLGMLAKHPDIDVDLDAETVIGWKKRYIAIYDSSLARVGATAKGKARRAVIVKTFNALIACLDEDDEEDAPKPVAKKSSTKKAAAKSRGGATPKR